MEWLHRLITPPNQTYYQRALERQNQLTKPPGSLGCLENMAVRLAAMQETEKPALEKIWISVFAADHGIVEESVSAYPQSVTAEMVKNFANGGAAINVLARQLNAHLEVVDVGVLQRTELNHVVNARVAAGTTNFLRGKAMTEAQLHAAMAAGKAAVQRAMDEQSQMFIGGEMGIGNTSSASAIVSAMLDVDPFIVTGAGTGLDDASINKKAELIKTAVQKHRAECSTTLSVLRCLGGFEIVALTGAYLRAAQQRLPVMIDGFIATTAALAAVKIRPQAAAWFFYAHRSQEKGHKLLLEALDVRPLLDLDMRLGEASGAAIAAGLLKNACAIHNEMATFKQAQVSTAD